MAEHGIKKTQVRFSRPRAVLRPRDGFPPCPPPESVRPMHRPAVPALACLLLAACSPSSPPASAPPAAATGTPLERVTASMQAFQDARSFHAEMHLQGARETRDTLDFVAPDRYRLQMPIGTQVIVGNVLYLQSQGRTEKLKLPEGMVAQWRDPMRVHESRGQLRVREAGVSQIDGVQARQYEVTNGPARAPVQFTYWIGPDGLPLQLRHSGLSQQQPYTMTVRYSRFNDPSIVIDTPVSTP